MQFSIKSMAYFSIVSLFFNEFVMRHDMILEFFKDSVIMLNAIGMTSGTGVACSTRVAILGKV